MKYILTLTLLLLMSGFVHAEEISFRPEPIPAPTSFIPVMEVEHNESVSSKSVKAKLKVLAAEIKKDKVAKVIIIYYGRNNRSAEALRMANQIKNHLLKKQVIEAKRIVAIHGGKQGGKKIEIYFLPSDTVELGNSRTLDSSEVMDYRAKLKKHKQ